MALVDANYKFTYIDVGSNGRVSDGGVFRECSLQSSLDNNMLDIPKPKPLPGSSDPIPHVIVADEAFPLKEYLMKPYPQRGGLDDAKRIFNYRLSRARRIVENAFGILSNRFRVLRAPILLSPEKAEKLVMCCCVLHNFLRPDTFRADNQETSFNGQELPRLQTISGNHSSVNARNVRDEFKNYFSSTGQVPWQYKVIA